MEELKCLRCGYKWFPRISKKPALCPGCKSRYWDSERKRGRDAKVNPGKSKGTV